jgi:hypothetical protein
VRFFFAYLTSNTPITTGPIAPSASASSRARVGCSVPRRNLPRTRRRPRRARADRATNRSRSRSFTRPNLARAQNRARADARRGNLDDCARRPSRAFECSRDVDGTPRRARAIDREGNARE